MPTDSTKVGVLGNKYPALLGLCRAANISRSLLAKKMPRCDKDSCLAYARRRLPILSWLKTYEPTWLPHDALAGFTVGLTAIPQGIAYGIVAELSPEYGLYASFMASFVYIVFGSCRSITIGPTAIMATMVRPLVSAYGPDVVVLLTFLKGCVIAVLGFVHLGCILDFISLPVIAGFTAAASVNIAASQFKSLLGIPGRSENLVGTFVTVFSNLRKIRYQDASLGIATIATLVLFKNLPGHRNGTWSQKIAWAVRLGRNALVVVAGAAVAYIFFLHDEQPFQLTGSIGNGLPSIGSPPFSMTVNNRTYNFLETVTAMGTTLFTVPVVSTVQHMAIAKAFTMGKSLDATQEMFALGMCNVFGSLVRSIPVTGSFTRTAVNHSSGVKTTLGGVFTGCLVLLASSLLSSTFRFIPRATLAGVIISAMYYMLDFKTYALLWRAKKIDFLTMSITLSFCVFYKLEWGILVGVLFNLLVLLYFSTRPSIRVELEQVEGKVAIRVTPEETISFPAAEYLRATVAKLVEKDSCNVLFDCKHLKRIDVTVAMNLRLLSNDLRYRGQTIACINCQNEVQAVLKSIAPDL